MIKLYKYVTNEVIPLKRFWIISSIMILLAAGVFGYSLFHYVQVENEKKATNDQVATKTLETVEATKASENKSTNAEVPAELNDNGMFSESYSKAYTQIMNMTDEQLTGMVIMGTCSDFNDEEKTAAAKYSLSGMLFNSECFDGKTDTEIKDMISSAKSSRPGFIAAVDEEGGSVTAITDHDAFTDYSFDSIGNLYKDNQNSLTEVEKMESEKANLLKECGISLNLAPVVDLASQEDAIMYSQSLHADSTDTGQYASFVTETYQKNGVSACLRHFPGYGNLQKNEDENVVKDDRTKAQLSSEDFLPFKSGISSKCHFVMMSNILSAAIDSSKIVSLSENANKILREELEFTGIVITDNLDNNDYSDYAGDNDVATAAILAGNDMILVYDYKTAYENILSSVKDGTIPKITIQKAAMRVLAYKLQTGLTS